MMFPQRDPDRLDLHESSRARIAARHVQSLHPGALGRLVARELLAYVEFGCRFPQDGLTESVIREVLADHDRRCRAQLPADPPRPNAQCGADAAPWIPVHRGAVQPCGPP